MVAAGSTRETREQLFNFVGSTNLETINMKASKIMEIISSEIDKTKSDGATVSFVSGAWVDLLHSIRPSFSKLLKDTYQAEVKAVDFQQKEEVCKEVNSWASRSTEGLINKILSPQHLGKDSMLILANTLFFKAAWEYPFTSTKNEKFHLLSGETIKAPLMTREKFRKLKGASFDGFKLVRIPYLIAQDDREFAMYMFLPNDKNGLVGLMERFSEDSSFLDQEFELEQGVLSEFWIPKFKFSHGFSVLDALKRLGLDRMFMNVGELTEIVSDNSSELLFLSDILQNSYIAVDEQGTEAASVTMGVSYGSARFKIPREKFSFKADHPFMFLIREEFRKVNLFIGTVLNPVLG